MKTISTLFKYLLIIKSYIIKYVDIFDSSMTQDRSTTHPKFDWTRIRTHDLQIMDSTFHVRP